MCSTEWTRRYFLRNAAVAGAAVAAVPALPRPASAASAPWHPAPQARVTLTNVRVFDGRTITAPSSVTIESGLIGFSPLGTRTIDAHGAVLLPGLIDAH